MQKVNKPSLKDIYLNYIFMLQVDGRSTKTIEWYRMILDDFIEYIGNFNNLNILKVYEYIAFLKKRNLKPATTNDYTKAIKIFLKYLFENNFIDIELHKKIKKQTLPKQYPYILNDEQVAKLLKACPKKTFEDFRNYVILLTFLDTGIRLSELLNLTVNDVNLIKRSLLIRSGKGQKEREVYMGKSLVKALAQYIKKRGFIPYEDKLFITSSGKPLQPRTVQKIIKELGKKAGIAGVRCSPHTLRHTFATNFIRNGGDIFTLQRILGHSDISTCMIYVHIGGKDVQIAMSKFSPIDRFIR
jgi:site-specific recombinase XerD